MRIDLRRAFRPADDDGRYVERMQEAKGESGVYVIIDDQTRDVLYVGESHSGRLFDTLTRHFRAWRIDPSADAQGRRRGGTTYDRGGVLVAFVTTGDDDAADIQEEEIARMDPRDNTNGFPVEPPF